MPWGGGNFTLGFNNRRQDSTSSFNTFNPQYNSTFSALFVQPLLRNLRTDPTRTQLRITAINRDVSELQLRATITNTLADVRNAYWDHVYAVDALQVARRSLELARKLLEDNRIRVEVGTLAPIDVVQAEAEVASRLQEEAQAEATARIAELALKRLIGSGADDPRWRARIRPVDRPPFAPAPIDLDAALRHALDARLDLAQSRKQLQANDLSLRLLGNQRLPAADVSASYGLQGIGGARLIRDSNLGGQVVDTVPGGYGDALRLLRERDFPQWNPALSLSYPIGASLADANYARARITVRQTQAQIKALELQIATDVTNAALLVESNQKRVDAARAARELAQRRLEAETSKFEVGLSTNFFVVQAQRDLAAAENIELRTRLDYQKSLVDFDRVQETSLGSAGISVVTTGTGAGRGQ
jgi:outer membrane protein TolC